MSTLPTVGHLIGGKLTQGGTRSADVFNPATGKAEKRVLLADISKLQRLLGHTPNTDMRATVQEILGYWRARVKQLYVRASPGDEL